MWWCWWWLVMMVEVGVCLWVGPVEGATPPSRHFNIGGVLHDNLTQQHFSKALKRINFDGVSVADKTTLYEVTTVQKGSPITTALHVCDRLISHTVYAVVVASDPGAGGSVTTAAVSYTCGFYHIPVICTHSRDSGFSNKNIHVSLLRTVPPYSQQAEVWVSLLKHLQYRQVILIHSSDTDGRAIYTRFQSLAQYRDDDKGIKLVTVVEFTKGAEAFVEKLAPLREELVKVFLLYANEKDSERIFHDANYLNMTGPGYVWLVTEQALNAHHAPAGTLGFKLKYAHDYDAHLTDSLRVVALALRRLHEQHEVIPEPPVNCDAEDGWDQMGRTLFSLIREQVLADGMTGKVAFDSHGDRTHAEYSLMNVQEQRPEQDRHQRPSSKTLVPVGEFFYDKASDQMMLKANTSKVVWPGAYDTTPPGYSLPTHLEVMTLQEMPFVYTEPITREEECSGEGHVLCPLVNDTIAVEELRCCWGYCIDLLITLARNNGFNFSLHLSPDGQYGKLLEAGEEGKEWSGMIGQLVNESAGIDMLMAPLTINPERSRAIHFSKPFKYQGITILVKRRAVVPALVSILQPFHGMLWLLLLVTVHGIALIIWLVDRHSPAYKHDGEDSDSLVLSESFWFSWSVILNSGLTEGTPRCLSGRVLGIIWAGFAMIMVASYTANLAAFLVLDSPVSDITGISDPRLRNPVENFTFATVKGSAVEMFFRRKTEWANMYRVMEAHSYPTVDQAVDAVRQGTLQAFIWESSRLEFEAAKDCDLVTVGELFGRSGYGIGLKKGSPWADKITLDILDLHERGYMEDLDKTWIWNNGDQCADLNADVNLSKRLGLRNLEGIFIMVAGGILSGTVLIVVELLYERCKNKGPVKEEDERSREEGESTPMIQGASECRHHDDNDDDDDEDDDDVDDVDDDDNDDSNSGEENESGVEDRKMLRDKMMPEAGASSGEDKSCRSKVNVLSTGGNSQSSAKSYDHPHGHDRPQQCCWEGHKHSIYPAIPRKTVCRHEGTVDDDAEDKCFLEDPSCYHECPGNIIQEVEERLRISPNIPEELKTRTPLQWFQHYLEILKKDAAANSAEVAAAAAQGAVTSGYTPSSEEVAIMEDFVDFIKESGIKDFGELYRREECPCSQQFWVECDQDDNQCTHCDEEMVDSANCSYHDDDGDGPALAVGGGLVSGTSSATPAVPGTSDTNNPVTVKVLTKALKDNQLPDVVDNCSDREMCLQDGRDDDVAQDAVDDEAKTNLTQVTKSQRQRVLEHQKSSKSPSVYI